MSTRNVVLGHRWLLSAAFGSSLLIAAFGMSGCDQGLAGPAGVAGPAGPEGPAGPQGPMGSMGNMGTMGTMGNQGTPGTNGTNGITPSRRAVFSAVNIGMGSSAGTTTNLLGGLTGGVFTFTTPATTAANSEAVVTASGNCQVSADPGGGTTSIVIQPSIMGSTLVQAGNLQVQGPMTGSYEFGFSATIVVPVAAGTQYSPTLNAVKTTTTTTGTTTSDACSGVITAQIFNQEMQP